MFLSDYNYFKKKLPEWMKPEDVETGEMFKAGGVKVKILHQPLGVVGIVAPWNGPIGLSIGAPLGQALAAGNRVILKPSSKTPQTSALIKEMVEAAFDPTEVAVFLGSGEVNDAFCSLPFDKIMLTGSPRVGREVLARMADNMVPAILELGGKNPVIIGKEADLDYAVETIWGAKMLNSGQICVNADHVFIPPDKQEAFINKSRTVLSKWFPVVKDDPTYTAIINDANYRRLLGYIAEAKKKGVRVEQLTNPNEPLSTRFRQIPPTIIVNPPEDLGVMRDEVFGPLMPVLVYENLDALIDLINHRPRPLALYYFGIDQNNIKALEERTTAGGMTINDIMQQSWDENVPFGGIGNSGMGKYHGHDGFLCFTTNKAIAYQNPKNPMRTMFHPPYTEEKLAMVKGMLPKV